jgi:hypothetical protein
MAEFGIQKEDSMRIAHLQKDGDADNGSSGMTAHTNLSPSLDMSFCLTDHSSADEEPSSAPIAAKRLVDANDSTSPKQPHMATETLHDLYLDKMITPDDQSETNAIGCAAVSATSLDVGGDEGPDNFNQSTTSVASDDDAGVYALPGAFSVYSKLADVRRGKDSINHEDAGGQIPEVHSVYGHEEPCDGVGNKHQLVL